MTHSEVSASMAFMARRTMLSDQIRAAVDRSGMSRYRICQESGIDQPSMSRFMSGQGGLSVERLDQLAAVLDLRIVAGKSRQRKGR